MFELISVAAILFWCTVLPLRAAGRLGPRRRVVRPAARPACTSAAAKVPPAAQPALALTGPGPR